MLKKTYGLVYRKGRWHVKNYRRLLIIKSKKIVSMPAGPKEDYEPQGSAWELPTDLEPGDLIAFREASLVIPKGVWRETEPGKVIRDETDNRPC